ncbi:zinc resistance protein [bacterium BMS3Bbin06]|nr:zinc resistance protein [bacterium BMS3Bbin06]
MQRNRLFGIIFCAVLLILFSADLSHAQWWKNKDLTAKLKLTEKQSKAIDVIYDGYVRKLMIMSKKLMDNNRKLNQLLLKEDIDEKEVIGVADEVTGLRRSLMMDTLTMKLTVRRLLNKGQIKSLLNERPRVFTLKSRWGGREAFRKAVRRMGAAMKKKEESK